MRTDDDEGRGDDGGRGLRSDEGVSMGRGKEHGGTWTV